MQLAGPALLLSTVTPDPHASAPSPSPSISCLNVALQLLERGCRLDREPGADAEKSPGGTDPLTMASEAELRLRGLMLLTRLTDNTAVRVSRFHWSCYYTVESFPVCHQQISYLFRFCNCSYPLTRMSEWLFARTLSHFNRSVILLNWNPIVVFISGKSY